ncbi:MAG: hypothetical protein DRI36_06715 [Caldiserica bacterium]|nr:MAG: hypothetical protein DRI36_06715 [Caldisericota bacterium]
MKEILFPEKGIKINIISFSYRFGIPKDADIVIDARCLPNPHYVERLKSLIGKDRRVKNFIFKNKEAKDFIEKLESFFDFSIPLFEKEGKNVLIIAVGCTGGRHRSVAVGSHLKTFLKKKGYRVNVFYRDI